MANRTAWTAGNGVGLTWTAAFAAGDLTSLADSAFVLSSATPIANGGTLDIYADFSAAITVSSSTPRAGAYIGVYLVPLIGDGATYGDGQFAAGTQKAAQPPYAPVGTIPLQNTAMTVMAGLVQGIVIPPGTFLWGVYNYSNVGFSGTAANNKAWYRTYNLQLNN
jgi:hypothetical protein